MDIWNLRRSCCWDIEEVELHLRRAKLIRLNYLLVQEPGPGKETRFTSTKPAKEIISSIEEAAKPLGFNVQKRDYKMKLQGDKHGRKGHLSVATEVSCVWMLRMFSIINGGKLCYAEIMFWSFIVAFRFSRLHPLFSWLSYARREEIHWSIIM